MTPDTNLDAGTQKFMDDADATANANLKAQNAAVLPDPSNPKESSEKVKAKVEKSISVSTPPKGAAKSAKKEDKADKPAKVAKVKPAGVVKASKAKGKK